MIAAPNWYEHNVSRETLEALDHFAQLIRQWTQKINLVAPSTLPGLETRHIWDSAQIYEGQSGKWVDMGSGGGLPGIVVAILRKGDQVQNPMILIESDQRKCAFLRACKRDLDLNIEIVASRIERAAPQAATVLSARALASLSDLLEYAERHIDPKGTCLFQKGAAWREEIDAAQSKWRFSYEALASKTNPEASTLVIRDIERV